MSQPSSRRHSPAVYRRRRLMVLLIVVAVVAAVVWLLVAQPWRGAAAERAAPDVTASDTASAIPAPNASTPAPTAAETAPAEATSAETPAPAATESTAPPEPAPLATPAAAACTSRNVNVDAVADQSTYPSGQLPKLSIRLTNHGSTDCTINVGTTQQVFTISSGSDTWWRSTDCQTAPSDMLVLVSAGQTVSSAQPVEWDRTRSSVSTCGGDRQRAPGGGASYHLKVSIGGIASSGSAHFMLY